MAPSTETLSFAQRAARLLFAAVLTVGLTPAAFADDAPAEGVSEGAVVETDATALGNTAAGPSAGEGAATVGTGENDPATAQNPTPMPTAAPAASNDENAPVISVSDVNAAYLDYLEDPNAAASVPSTLDLSYLATEGAEASTFSLNNRAATLPASFDLRQSNTVGAVQNQQSTSNCWAFAAVGSAEASLAPYFPHTSLSPAHLAWFSYNGNEEIEVNGTASSGAGAYNTGAFEQQAVASMAAWKGPVLATDVPFLAEQVDESLRYQARYHLQDAVFLPSSINGYYDRPVQAGVDEIKTILHDLGPVTVSIATQGANTYTTEAGTEDKQYSTFFTDTVGYIDHTVLIVGWDDNFSRTNFAEGHYPESDGAWLIRNSWGTDRGTAGYYWLSYEDKSAIYGVNYQLESADNYTDSYQFDTMGWATSLAVSSTGAQNPDAEGEGKGGAGGSAFMANIFTAEGAEELQAVSFYTTDKNTSYEINVYANPSEGNPASGTRVGGTQTGTEVHPGYHTIELDQGLRAHLDAGMRFSVVVKLTNPTYANPIAAEAAVGKGEGWQPTYLGKDASGNAEVSYVSANGTTWAPLGLSLRDSTGASVYASNVCLKAFTNDEGAQPTVWPPAENDTATLGGMNARVSYTVQYDGGEPFDSSTDTPLDFTQDESGTWHATLVVNNNTDRISPFTISLLATGQRNVTATFTQADQASAGGNAEAGAAGSLGQNPEANAGGNLQANAGTVAGTSEGAGPGENSQPDFEATALAVESALTCNEWSKAAEFDPAKGSTATLRVTSADTGGTGGTAKQPATYEITLVSNQPSFDYLKETVTFDENALTVLDPEGNPLASGANVGKWSVVAGLPQQYLTVTEKSEGGRTYQLAVPARHVAPTEADLTLDYFNETMKVNAVASIFDTSPDETFSAPTPWWPEKTITPGSTFYLRAAASYLTQHFASEPLLVELPARPAAPIAPAVLKVSSTSATMQQLTEGGEPLQYSIDGMNWGYNNIVSGLDAGKTTKIHARTMASTQDPENPHFASEPVEIIVTTLAVAPCYDVREAQAATSVKDQTATSLCWSFAAIAAMESSLLMQGAAESPDISETSLAMLTFQRQETAAGDASAEDRYLTNPSEGGLYFGLRTGGTWQHAASTLARWQGSAAETNVPFVPVMEGNFEEAGAEMNAAAAAFATQTTARLKSAVQLPYMFTTFHIPDPDDPKGGDVGVPEVAANEAAESNAGASASTEQLGENDMQQPAAANGTAAKGELAAKSSNVATLNAHNVGEQVSAAAAGTTSRQINPAACDQIKDAIAQNGALYIGMHEPYESDEYWGDANLAALLKAAEKSSGEDAGSNGEAAAETAADSAAQPAQETAVAANNTDSPHASNPSHWFYNASSKGLHSNHAMALSGWDDSYNRFNFAIAYQEGMEYDPDLAEVRTLEGGTQALVPKEDGAWLIKNSRGTNFGAGGYLWVPYCETTLTAPVAFVAQAPGGNGAFDTQNNYQYDGVHAVNLELNAQSGGAAGSPNEGSSDDGLGSGETAAVSESAAAGTSAASAENVRRTASGDETIDSNSENEMDNGADTPAPQTGTALERSTSRGANVFTARGAEELRSIGTWVTVENARLDYRVYTNLSNPADPESGTLAASGSAVMPYLGYFTIDLANAVSLNAGETFSVVVSETCLALEMQGHFSGVPIEAAANLGQASPNEPARYDAEPTVAEGQSFIFEEGAWKDVVSVRESIEERVGAPVGNLAIKAFTANASKPDSPGNPNQPSNGGNGKNTFAATGDPIPFIGGLFDLLP